MLAKDLMEKKGDIMGGKHDLFYYYVK